MSYIYTSFYHQDIHVYLTNYDTTTKKILLCFRTILFHILNMSEKLNITFNKPDHVKLQVISIEHILID